MTLTSAFRDARDAILSYGQASGFFERVAGHEPKSAPGKGLSMFVFAGAVDPHPASSGLSATSVRFTVTTQLRCSMTREPQDDIDLDLIEAADAVCAALSGDFDLGASVRAVDLLGTAGASLACVFGYIDQDGHKFRVVDIAVPCLVNNVWSQGA